MSRRAIAIIVLLLAVVGLVVWLTTRDKNNDEGPLLSISAVNQTKNKPATDQPASPQDVIVYTLTAENHTNDVISGYIMEANISEITDKAVLLDASGASYNAGTSSLVWTPLDIPANESISKTFSVRVNSVPNGSTDTVMRIRFNNELVVSVASNSQVAGNTNPPATSPGSNYVAPPTGASEMVPVFLAALVTLAFVFRKKLLGITLKA